MEEKESEFDDIIVWLLEADRRLIVLKTIDQNKVIKAADIAKKTGRSLTNICYAIRELEDRGLVECITPEKCTWKRFIFTEKSRLIFEKLKSCIGTCSRNDI